MEILATHTEASVLFYVLLFVGVCVFGFGLIYSVDFAGRNRVLAGVICSIGLGIFFSALQFGTYEAYDAIVTDWNEVYEQGYEIVETNGKIVTLRKVDE